MEAGGDAREPDGATTTKSKVIRLTTKEPREPSEADEPNPRAWPFDAR
jgi:hypothetical protein